VRDLRDACRVCVLPSGFFTEFAIKTRNNSPSPNVTLAAEEVANATGGLLVWGDSVPRSRRS
jgi:hypothetical protein